MLRRNALLRLLFVVGLSLNCVVLGMTAVYPVEWCENTVGRGVRRLLSVENTIKLDVTEWGEPHFGTLDHYVELDQDDDIRLDLTDVSEVYPHNLIKPNGELHTALQPGELNIIKAPHSAGNYSIEAPSAWGDYERPIIHIRRKLQQWGAHPKLMAGGKC